MIGINFMKFRYLFAIIACCTLISALISGCGDTGNKPNRVPTIQITQKPPEILTVNSAVFAWTAADADGSIAGYYYDLDDSSPDTWTTTNSVTFENMIGGSHTFYVQAKDDKGALSSKAQASFYLNQLPSAPYLVSPSNNSRSNDQSPTLIWSVVYGANNYQVQIDSTSDFSPPDRYHQTGSSQWTVTPDLSYGAWYWRARAHNGTGWGDYSAVWSFTIDEDRWISVSSPNGDETWTDGGSATITWTSQNAGSYVKIELYKSGSLCRTISSSTSNDGSYTWTPVNGCGESGQYKVKIISTSYSSCYDWSDGYFTIDDDIDQCIITVVSPNGGETWTDGQPATITWTSENAGSYVKIELYKSGSFCRTIISSTSNDGSYTWTPVNGCGESSYYKVKITDTLDPNCNDYSNGYFTIDDGSGECIITVVSPNGGETWTDGQPATITWTSQNAGNYVKIHLFKSGSFCRTITSSTSNDGSYTWTPVNGCGNSSQYQVNIEDTFDSSCNDATNGYFTIDDGSGDCNITVVSPNGGETWTDGQPATITWTSQNAGNYVKIELYKSGSFCRTITSNTSNDGLYTWSVNDCGESSYYKVKITSTSYSDCNDLSNNYFTIQEQIIRWIIVSSPNGGETWTDGQPATITWTSQNAGSYVKIELYDGSTLCRTISSSTYNDGSHTWTVNGCGEFDYYLVKITSTTYLDCYDWSNAYFTILEPEPVWLEITFYENFIMDVDGNYPMNHRPLAGQSFRVWYDDPSWSSCNTPNNHVHARLNPWGGFNSFLYLFEEGQAGIYVDESATTVTFTLTADFKNSDPNDRWLNLAFGSDDCILYFQGMQTCQDYEGFFTRDYCGPGPYYGIVLQVAAGDDEVAVSKIRIDFNGWYGDYRIFRDQGQIKEIREVRE